jgi:transposase
VAFYVASGSRWGQPPQHASKGEQVGAYFGLTPTKYQSGETDIDGPISKIGDTGVRTVLYEAANIILSQKGRHSINPALSTLP